jgi:hypothetical protein
MRFRIWSIWAPIFCFSLLTHNNTDLRWAVSDLGLVFCTMPVFFTLTMLDGILVLLFTPVCLYVLVFRSKGDFAGWLCEGVFVCYLLALVGFLEFCRFAGLF